jgi:lysophospholipid acyltransferase (LPLAT)-like uncharacterized protein
MAVRLQSLTPKLGGLSTSIAVRAWMGTIDFQAVLYDPTVDPVREDYRGPVICIFWHEYLLSPFYLRGRTNSAILTSRHRDAEWLSQAARHLGFRIVRGSTNRGGSQALLELMRKHGARNLGIACDGPRGPRRRLAPGPVYLSSRLQVPLVAYAVGYHAPWRMPTWDRFALPRPGCRGRVIVGPRLQIPPRLSREGIEHYRRRVEGVLLCLTQEAETWAESGSRRLDQHVARCQPARIVGPQHALRRDPWSRWQPPSAHRRSAA